MTLDMYDFFFFKQKTAYEMRISDWSSDVCSSDLPPHPGAHRQGHEDPGGRPAARRPAGDHCRFAARRGRAPARRVQHGHGGDLMAKTAVPPGRRLKRWFATLAALALLWLGGALVYLYPPHHPHAPGQPRHHATVGLNDGT